MNIVYEKQTKHFDRKFLVLIIVSKYDSMTTTGKLCASFSCRKSDDSISLGFFPSTYKDFENLESFSVDEIKFVQCKVVKFIFDGIYSNHSDEYNDLDRLIRLLF